MRFLTVWFRIFLALTLLWALAGFIRHRRRARQERKLDFSKCYHNTPHAYLDASEEDIYCCDICGRPYDDVLHKTK